MEDQDQRTEEQANGTGQDASTARGTETQVGQIVRSLTKVTRQLPVPEPPPPRRAPAQPANAALRERIGTLIAALGDPTHPLHHQAVDDLVAIGPPAVPALNEALNPRRPWLAAYRAAEALGQIGDGRAAGALLDALRHPNSNVRWSAVRALAVVGDARALLELRRVAREDQGKTSWGESVAGAAQSVLDQMPSRTMILRGADLLKTAFACVLMLVALILAWSVITTLRSELRQFGRVPARASAVAPLVPTPIPTSAPVEAIEPVIAPTAPATEPTAAPANLARGTVLTTANVRAQPTTRGDRIGGVSEGDEILFLAMTPDRQWYRIKLGERHADGSRIDSPDGSGWVHRSLLSEPQGEVLIEPGDSSAPTPTAAP
jgi:hypothetical protein